MARNVENFSKWKNPITGEIFMVVGKWGRGFQLTSYELVNLETEEYKRVAFEYMQQCIDEERMIRTYTIVTPDITNETKQPEPAKTNNEI